MRKDFTHLLHNQSSLNFKKYNLPKLVTIIIAMQFVFVFHAFAQQANSTNGRSGITEVIPGGMITEVIMAPGNKPVPNSNDSSNATHQKHYFDNGYIRYELTGDPVKDADTYKQEKEKLIRDNPKLYEKWVNGGVSSNPSSKKE